MARLYRPHIPVSVRIAVIQRQAAAHYLKKLGKPYTMVSSEKSLQRQLNVFLAVWAGEVGCQVSDLRLDHDPPLGARPQHRKGLGKKTYYIPDANDPDHLFYRPHGPQFEGSHLIKTNVRGDNGQYPDRVLIKRAKRRERGLKKKPKKKWASRPFPRGRSFGRSRHETSR